MEETKIVEQEQGLLRIGDDAPHFEAVTTQGNINFPEDYEGKWVILFSHPADFTLFAQLNSSLLLQCKRNSRS